MKLSHSKSAASITEKMSDKQLGPVRVRPVVRHAQNTARIVHKLGLDLISERLLPERFPASSGSRRIARLYLKEVAIKSTSYLERKRANHELPNVAMKQAVVVIPCLC